MDEMYGLQPPPGDHYCGRSPPENLLLPEEHGGDEFFSSPFFGSDGFLSAASAISDAAMDGEDRLSRLLKARIAAHPAYPRLLRAYLDCQKVGAPPEIASFLEEIRRRNEDYSSSKRDAIIHTCCFGADPELDEFMETYCEMLVKYKSDLARPFDEATTFLNKIETQLSHLCTADHANNSRPLSDEGGASSAEEVSGGEGEVELEGQDSQLRPGSEDRHLKDQLRRRFGGRISNLKLEFSKKKKKGKLPREARQTLLDWWTLHYKWPYPTEADKYALADATGLDQKQINNWFINQRKRHWKPSENMQFAVMDNLSGQFYRDE